MGHKIKSQTGFPITILSAHEVMGINECWKPGEPTAITIHRTPITWRFGIASRTAHGERWAFFILPRPNPFDALRRHNWQMGVVRIVMQAIVELYPDLSETAIEEILR